MSLMSIVDYREISQSIANNIDILFESHPDAFDVLLFKAKPEALETVSIMPDVVGSLESNERAIEYEDPIKTRAFRVPDDLQNFLTLDGSMPNDNQDNPVILYIQERDIPAQSVIQYHEYINQKEARTVTLYLLKSEAIGKSPSISVKHYFIPMGENFGR
ncbi:MAG: hypothetical protein HQK79_20715 [Desulfobacterales bacterium]|nr:hypothetical protein [Desulfobacterales bacterium]